MAPSKDSQAPREWKGPEPPDAPPTEEQPSPWVDGLRAGAPLLLLGGLLLAGTYWMHLHPRPGVLSSLWGLLALLASTAIVGGCGAYVAATSGTEGPEEEASTEEGSAPAVPSRPGDGSNVPVQGSAGEGGPPTEAGKGSEGAHPPEWDESVELEPVSPDEGAEEDGPPTTPSAKA